MGVDGERWRGEGGEVLRAGSRLERVMTADGGDRSGQKGTAARGGGGTRTGDRGRSRHAGQPPETHGSPGDPPEDLNC